MSILRTIQRAIGLAAPATVKVADLQPGMIVAFKSDGGFLDWLLSLFEASNWTHVGLVVARDLAGNVYMIECGMPPAPDLLDGRRRFGVTMTDAKVRLAPDIARAWVLTPVDALNGFERVRLVRDATEDDAKGAVYGIDDLLDMGLHLIDPRWNPEHVGQDGDFICSTFISWRLKTTIPRLFPGNPDYANPASLTAPTPGYNAPVKLEL